MKKIGSMTKIALLSIVAAASGIVCASEIIEHEHRQMLTQYSSPYASDYNKVNAEMHKGMNVYDKGDPDVYFVESMLAHHIGAVEMAEVQLKYGMDDEMRQLARDIIATQDIEIKMMKQWLKDHKPEPIQGVPVPRSQIDSSIKLEQPVPRYPDLPTNVHKNH